MSRLLDLPTKTSDSHGNVMFGPVRSVPNGLVNLIDRLGARRTDSDGRVVSTGGDAVFATKALRKFLGCLTARESPVLLDLGPVVGSNVSFFGEQLGCKIFVEDIFADLDRHVRDSKLDALPELLTKRFPQESNSVDGILCWDLIDYLDKKAAQELATQLTRLVRPDGAILGFFGGTRPPESRYTKFIIVDEANLKYRSYPAARGPQTALLNRDIIRLFQGLRVSESFLMKNNVREILFRKP
jgi:hypothetical protein